MRLKSGQAMQFPYKLMARLAPHFSRKKYFIRKVTRGSRRKATQSKIQTNAAYLIPSFHHSPYSVPP